MQLTEVLQIVQLITVTGSTVVLGSAIRIYNSGRASGTLDGRVTGLEHKMAELQRDILLLQRDVQLQPEQLRREHDMRYVGKDEFHARVDENQRDRERLQAHIDRLDRRH